MEGPQPAARGEAPVGDYGWAHRAVFRGVRALVQAVVLMPALRFLTPVGATGRRQLSDLGPVVFVANHQSHLDTPVCLAALGARARYRLAVAAAADYFYRSRLRGVFVSLVLGTVPFVRAGGSSRPSLEALKDLVAGGTSVLLFPSGTRGSEAELKPGFAYLAVDAGVPVVPVFLAGPEHVMPKGSRLPLPGGVAVHIGRPIPPGHDYQALVVLVREAFTEVRDGPHRAETG